MVFRDIVNRFTIALVEIKPESHNQSSGACEKHTIHLDWDDGGNDDPTEMSLYTDGMHITINMGAEVTIDPDDVKDFTCFSVNDTEGDAWKFVAYTPANLTTLK